MRLTQALIDVLLRWGLAVLLARRGDLRAASAPLGSGVGGWRHSLRCRCWPCHGVLQTRLRSQAFGDHNGPAGPADTAVPRAPSIRPCRSDATRDSPWMQGHAGSNAGLSRGNALPGRQAPRFRQPFTMTPPGSPSVGAIAGVISSATALKATSPAVAVAHGPSHTEDAAGADLLQLASLPRRRPPRQRVRTAATSAFRVWISVMCSGRSSVRGQRLMPRSLTRGCRARSGPRAGHCRP